MRKAIGNERRQNQGQNQWRSCDITLTVIISRRKKKGNRYERHKTKRQKKLRRAGLCGTGLSFNIVQNKNI